MRRSSLTLDPQAEFGFVDISYRCSLEFRKSVRPSMSRPCTRLIELSVYAHHLHLHAQYSLSYNPLEWGLNLSPSYIEDDDALHMPTKRHRPVRNLSGFSKRGVRNCGCLFVVIVGILLLL